MAWCSAEVGGRRMLHFKVMCTAKVTIKADIIWKPEHKTRLIFMYFPQRMLYRQLPFWCMSGLPVTQNGAIVGSSNAHGWLKGSVGATAPRKAVLRVLGLICRAPTSHTSAAAEGLMLQKMFFRSFPSFVISHGMWLIWDFEKEYIKIYCLKHGRGFNNIWMCLWKVFF